MDLQKWKTLQRTEILKHPRMHIVEDDVQLPDGKTTKYVRHAPGAPASVTIIAINDANEILLQKEYSYPPNEIMWQLPGGGVESGEDITAAAQRELSEESGITAKDCMLIGSYFTNNRRSDQKQFVVVGMNLEDNNIQGDDEEFIESRWTAREEIDRMIREGQVANVNMLAALNLWMHSDGYKIN